MQGWSAGIPRGSADMEMDDGVCLGSPKLCSNFGGRKGDS